VRDGNFHQLEAKSLFHGNFHEVFMAGQQFFTQEQIEAAKQQLENLPDLSPKRITRNEALENLRTTILMLAKEKGYTVKDIKSALDAMKFGFSERAISDVLKENVNAKKLPRGKKSTNSAPKNEEHKTVTQ
jgi:hypothetical protein